MESVTMIGKCSECGRRRKLYLAIGNAVIALWCANCIAKRRDSLYSAYETNGFYIKFTKNPQDVDDCEEFYIHELEDNLG